MKHWIKWTSMALIAILVATAFGASAVRAQDSTATPTPSSSSTTSATTQANANSPEARARAAFVRVMAGAILDAAAKDLNVDKTVLLKDVASGKTMAEVVTAHNGNVAQVEADAKPAIEDAINKAVSSGKLKQTLADAINKRLDKIIDRLMNAKFPNGRDRQENQLLAAAVGDLLLTTTKASENSAGHLLSEIHERKKLERVAPENKPDVNQ